MDQIKKKMASLRKQADDAEEALDQAKAEKKQMEAEICELHDEVNCLQNKLRCAQDELDCVSTQCDEAKGIAEEMKEHCAEAEAECKSSERKLILLEESTERLQCDLDKAREALAATELERDAKDRDLRKYINNEEDTATAFEEQNYKLKEAKDIAQMADTKYEEVCRKLQGTEEELARTEERLDEALEELKNLRTTVTAAHTDLKSYEAMQVQMANYQDNSERELEDLKRCKDEAERLCEEKSGEVSKLMKENESLEMRLEDKESELQKVKAEMDETLKELSVI